MKRVPHANRRVLWANDLDTMETRVRGTGAEITERPEFPGGRRFHFRDPNGNEIAVWSDK